MENENSKKRTQVNIRLSPVELEKVQLSAETLNISVGKYCKQLVLDSPLVRPSLNAESQQELIRQVSGMANNLNQLTKVARGNREVQKNQIETIDQLRKEIHQLWQQLVR